MNRKKLISRDCQVVLTGYQKQFYYSRIIAIQRNSLYCFDFKKLFTTHMSQKSMLLSEMSIAAEKLPLPRRDVRKKSYCAAVATRRLIKISCRDAMAYKLAAAAPLLQWFSKKCFKFHCRDCIGPEILVLDHQIHSVLGFFTCKH